MKVALEGKRALIIGGPGRLHAAIAEALAASGAVVEFAFAHAGSPWLLVNISNGAEIGPVPDDETAADSELDQFASAARALGAKRVINVISAAGAVPVRGAAAFSARQASLAALTRVLAMELGPEVLVNALAVGALAGDPPAAERFVSHSPLQRAAMPVEIGNAALSLPIP